MFSLAKVIGYSSPLKNVLSCILNITRGKGPVIVEKVFFYAVAMPPRSLSRASLNSFFLCKNHSLNFLVLALKRTQVNTEASLGDTCL